MFLGVVLQLAISVNCWYLRSVIFRLSNILLYDQALQYKAFSLGVS